MRILCFRCRQREANTVATGRWLCWSCFHLEANDVPSDERLSENRLGETSLMVLSFIQKYRGEVGIAPTLEEIARNVHLASRSVAKHHLDRLVRAGKIRRLPVNRGIVLRPEPVDIVLIGKEEDAGLKRKITTEPGARILIFDPVPCGSRTGGIVIDQPTTNPHPALGGGPAPELAAGRRP